jgi:predicted 2-oxoglutarate/Fe(II)-dependent dioxygenase YbiX
MVISGKNLTMNFIGSVLVPAGKAVIIPAFTVHHVRAAVIRGVRKAGKSTKLMHGASVVAP